MAEVQLSTFKPFPFLKSSGQLTICYETEFTMKPAFLAISLIIFVAGLNIPVISDYVLIIAAIWLLFRWLINMQFVDKAFSSTISLLALFAVSYYSFTYIHGITGLNEGVRNVISIVGSYALGYSIKKNNAPVWPLGLLFPIFCMTTGFITFSYLCVHELLRSGDLIQIAERVAVSFWDGSEINSPGLGANASLGMCLLPMALFGRDDEHNGKYSLLLALLTLVMLATGVYINAILQNRTPFLATAAALFFGTIVYLFRHKADRARAIKRTAIVYGSVGVILYFLVTTLDLSQLDILARFSQERLESLRYEAWGTMLSSLHGSLLGGRVIRLGVDLNYVHNLWLDVIWDAGIVPFVFLAIFHLKHARSFKRILKSDLPLLSVLAISGLAISFFVNFMQEPTISASVPYFAASCFFLGLVLRLSKDLETGDKAE